eukprot:2384780-Pyramimonas_sp.AAC.1
MMDDGMGDGCHGRMDDGCMMIEGNGRWMNGIITILHQPPSPRALGTPLICRAAYASPLVRGSRKRTKTRSPPAGCRADRCL